MMNVISNLVKNPRFNSIFLRQLSRTSTKKCSTSPELISTETRRQFDLFEAEERRQLESVGRIEKIEVQYEGVPENCLFTMNKNLSTPYDCAKHLPDKIKNRAAVALLNHETLWHMHRPLPDACTLELLHYHIPNPAVVNKVFWRTCSFLLGAVVADAFKDTVDVKLHSFPSPNVKSGSFVYDVQLNLDNWQPTEKELKVLSIEMIKLAQKNLPIKTILVDKEFALEMFKENPYKSEQIPDIAANNNEQVTLFRVGYHVDISRGPMAPNTSHLGRITVTNVFRLNTGISGGPIYRFQGVALPSPIVLNHFAYGLIEERGRTLNSGRVPGQQSGFNDDNSFVSGVTS